MKVLKNIFLNEIFIITVILLNTVLIFFEGFPNLNLNVTLIDTLHYTFLFIYIIELVFKLSEYGLRKYFKESLNRLDFFLVIISLPELFTLFTEIESLNLAFVFTLRSIRLIRVVRLFRVIALFESSKLLFRGVNRALKSSYLILFVFVVINFIFALLSNNLFSNVAPEYFGDPLKSLYSIFKVFTIEGWYEIPDVVTENYNNSISIWLVRLYFIVVLFIGGIFGLSIINSVFVEGVIHDEEEDKKLNEIINRLDKIEKKLKK